MANKFARVEFPPRFKNTGLPFSRYFFGVTRATVGTKALADNEIEGAEIFLEGDKLAVVAGQSAHTFSSNQDSIFVV